MSDMTSEEYKRGFITGLAMNPLMVTTETSVPTIQSGATGILGMYIINNIIVCTDGTEGGI